MSEEINYILESLRFKTSIYRDKKKRNLSFNDDEYYSNILIEYIEELQQENQKLKESYCNRTDCSGRLHDSRKYPSVKQQRDLYKSVLDEIRKIIKIEKEKMGYAIYDSCLLLIEEELDKVKENDC